MNERIAPALGVESGRNEEMTRAMMRGIRLLSAAALVLGVGAAQAQTGTCSAAKIKCASMKAVSLIKCHEKAEKKGLMVDALCIFDAQDRFNDPVKGCFPKAELTKAPCATSGDLGAIEAKVDAFVDDVVGELDPFYPSDVLNTCSSKKKKCVEKKVKGLLKCNEKNVKKPDPAKFAACVQRASDKFDGGIDPAKGCFAKLEAKFPSPGDTPCLSYGDTAALEAYVDAFVADLIAELVPPST